MHALASSLRRFAPAALAWALLMLLAAALAWTSAYDADEFHYLTQAKLVAGGAVITRDFFEFIMPGAFWLTGGVFQALGASLLTGRLLQAALIVGLAIGYFRLGRAWGLQGVLAWLAPLFLLGVCYLRKPWFSPHWFGQVGIGLALAAAWWALGTGRDRRWAVVGLAVGLTYACDQLDGAGLLAGLGLGALWVAWRQRWGWGATLKRAGWFVLGLMVPLLAIAGYFVAHGALGGAVWATHLWALGHYRMAGNHNDVAYAMDLSYMLSVQRHWISRAFWYAGLPVVLTITLLPMLAPALGGLWLAGLGRRPAENERRIAFAGLLVFATGFLFLAASRGRADLVHMLFILPPAALLAALGAAGWETAMRGVPMASGLRWAPRAAMLLVVAAHGFQFVEAARRDPSPWRSAVTPDQRIQAREAFRKLSRDLGPGDTIVAVNGSEQGNIFYFYLAPNATRFTSWAPPEDGYTTPEQLVEIRRDIATRRPRLILVPERTPERAERYVRLLGVSYRLEQVVDSPRPGTDSRVYVYARPAS